jgi:hypothetical protein
MPGVIERLHELVSRYVEREPDLYDSEVKKKVSEVNGYFRVEHSEGITVVDQGIHDVVGDSVALHTIQEHFKKLFGLPSLSISNMCCNACEISDGSLTPHDRLQIQLAAVNTDPVSEAA